MSWRYRVLALCGLAAVSLAWSSGSAEYQDDDLTQPAYVNMTGEYFDDLSCILFQTENVCKMFYSWLFIAKFEALYPITQQKGR